MASKQPDILLVESDRVLRDLILLALGREGLQTVHVSEAERAVSLCAHHQPDIVLLDLLADYADGLNLIRDMRAVLPASSAVVVISSLAFDEVVRQVVKAGANDFILKPLDVKVLVEKVKHGLECSQDSARKAQESRIVDLVEHDAPTLIDTANSSGTIRPWVPGAISTA